MPRSVRLWSFTLAALVVACSSADAPEEDVGEATAVTAEPIIGGTPAVAYPESALLDIDRSSTSGSYYVCSATLIAPRVVLTAGHCVDGHTKWNVYVQNELRAATSGSTFDWAEHGATKVNPIHHDLGLVYLDVPIILPSYPTLATSMLANGSKVQNIGRILNGVITSASYEAPAVVSNGMFVGYPFDYASADVIQPGDSGGAVMADGTHTLVAVNSGAGGGMQVLARVDLELAWIKAQIAAHPVAGADAGGAAPAPTPTPSAPSTAKPDAAAPVAPSCAAEKESNNTLATANAIEGSLCGALATGDNVDWGTLTVPAGSLTLRLSATGDAVFSLGRVAGSSCLLISTAQKAVRVTSTGGATPACVVISSPTHKTQTYAFSVSH